MFLGTHACLPVIAIGTVDLVRTSQKKEPLLKNWHLVFIGIAGMLPDLLWPHTSIQARLSSWTHTLWFLIVTLPIVYFISRRWIKKKLFMFVLFFWLAMALHIFADMVSGGVSFLYPIKEVFGTYYIAWAYWIRIDLLFVTATILVYLIRAVLRKRILKKVVQ